LFALKHGSQSFQISPLVPKLSMLTEAGYGGRGIACEPRLAKYDQQEQNTRQIVIPGQSRGCRPPDQTSDGMRVCSGQCQLKRQGSELLLQKQCRRWHEGSDASQLLSSLSLGPRQSCLPSASVFVQSAKVGLYHNLHRG